MLFLRSRARADFRNLEDKRVALAPMNAKLSSLSKSLLTSLNRAFELPIWGMCEGVFLEILGQSKRLVADVTCVLLGITVSGQVPSQRETGCVLTGTPSLSADVYLSRWQCSRLSCSSHDKF